MPPKNIRKRRKEVTDQGESSDKVESLDNVSKTSEDNPRQLPSKKHQARLREELGAKTQESVLPSVPGVGTDESEPAVESSEIIRTSSTTDLGEPVEEMTDSIVPNTEVADLGEAVLSPMDAYYSIQDSDPERFSESPDWLSSKKIFPSIQFLGIVSLYTNQSGSKVPAFRLHSFVLYSFDNKLKSTVVHLAITERRLITSTALERVSFP